MKQPSPIKTDIPARERLIFALDVPDLDRARGLVATLGDAVEFYKLGLEFFLSGHYFELAAELKAQGKKIFADLKLFDIPATVASAVRQLARHEVDFCTVHGNDAMLKAAAEAKGSMRILAVTALTSLDQGDLDDLGFQCDARSLVLSRAQRALALGCDGVVSSGLEVSALASSLKIGRMPGQTVTSAWSTVSRSAGTSSPDDTTPSQPRASARFARDSTRVRASHWKPRSSRSPWSRLVRAVTARICISPFSSAAARNMLSLPCTVQKFTCRLASCRTAEATVAGMSNSFRSAKIFLPASRNSSASSK